MKTIYALGLAALCAAGIGWSFVGAKPTPAPACCACCEPGCESCATLGCAACPKCDASCATCETAKACTKPCCAGVK